MANRPIVLGYAFTHFVGESGKKGVLPPPALSPGTFAGKNINFASYPGYTSNLAELQKAAASAGHFSLDPDPDGILRRVPMLAEFEGAYYEPLSLAIVRMILGGQNILPGYPSDKIWSRNYSGLEWLEVGPRRTPVAERFTSLIP